MICTDPNRTTRYESIHANKQYFPGVHRLSVYESSLSQLCSVLIRCESVDVFKWKYKPYEEVLTEYCVMKYPHRLDALHWNE